MVNIVSHKHVRRYAEGWFCNDTLYLNNDFIKIKKLLQIIYKICKNRLCH